jgi:hypothetical protein
LREHLDVSDLRFFRLFSLVLLVIERVARWSFTARIEGPLLYRGAFASKKDRLAAPSHSCISFSTPRTILFFKLNPLAF